jgi:hypothetical protein
VPHLPVSTRALFRWCVSGARGEVVDAPFDMRGKEDRRKYGAVYTKAPEASPESQLIELESWASGRGAAISR